MASGCVLRVNPDLSWELRRVSSGVRDEARVAGSSSGKGLQYILEAFLAELPDGQLLQGVESLPQRVPGSLGELSGLVRGLGGDHAGT